MRRSFNVTGILGESKFSHQPRSQGPLSRSRERSLGTRLFPHCSEMLQSLECKLVLVGVTRCRLEILISTSLIWTTGRFKEWRQRWRPNYPKFAYLTTRNRSFARFARAFFIFCTFRNSSRPINGEFKKWRQHWQRQRHKSMIWLVERRKVIVLHVRHLFGDVVGQTTTWKFHFWGSGDNITPQQ